MRLEIKKLMSSREFGELVRSEEPGFKSKTEYLEWYERLRNNFDDFLKQKLSLEMFVPCKLVNGVWVVLEEPKINNFHENRVDLYCDALEEYQEAKDRVLFEGLKFKDVQPSTEYNYYHINGAKIFEANNQYKFFPMYGFKTIEDLVKYNLELTPTSQKQIGI